MARLLPLLLSLAALTAISATPLAAQATTGVGPTTERVLIVGDSWAEFTWAFGSVDAALAAVGHPDKIAVGDVTALGGTTAADWNTPAYQSLIQQELMAHPTIDVIHLSIGGNDFLGAWNTGMTEAEEQALYTTIADDVEAVVAFIHSLDPDLEIVIGSYDYVNLEEQRSDFFTWLLWLGLGSPTPAEVNQELAASTSAVFRRLLADPKVHLLNNSGAMQYFFGYPAYGIAPRSLPLPGNEPQGWRPGLGGDPGLPSPPAAMLDGIHLNEAGYRIIARHAALRFYDGYFDANP